MNWKKLGWNLINSIVYTDITGISIIVFFLVLFLITGAFAMIVRYALDNQIADLWGYIFVFGSFALAGRTAMGTYSTFKWKYQDLLRTITQKEV